MEQCQQSASFFFSLCGLAGDVQLNIEKEKNEFRGSDMIHNCSVWVGLAGVKVTPRKETFLFSCNA